MAQVLEVLHFTQKNGVAYMDIRRGRIESCLDDERAFLGEFFFELLRIDDLLGPPLDDFKLLVDRPHGEGIVAYAL
jgi:hypothetical protein